MKTRVNAGTSKSVESVLRSLPIWKRKIQPWLSGKNIGDAPRGGEPAMMQIYPNSLRFFGPFATVTLSQMGDRWDATVSHNANPITMQYTDLKKAVSDWAGSVWHVAIRGVI